MNAQKPIIDTEGEVRELTAEDIAKFKPAKDALPTELYNALVALKKGRGPNKTPTKISTTVRLDADVLDSFRAMGPGWQTRINAALRQYITEHPLK